MMQLELTGDVPFREVYIHALVRDEKGKKMSKSLGNILDPIELIDKYGADAVRFTLTAMAVMGRDLKLSDERIAGYRNFGTKLWNAARFAEMNDCRPDPAFDPRGVTLTANKWIVGETGRLRETLDAALAAYRFNDAANALYAHVWGKVCDWYVELAKPLFDGDGAAETRATMAWVLDQCLILMHPVMPFITEALWGQIAARPKLLCHTDWPAYGSELIDPAADAEMNWVIGLIEEIRSVRAQLHVPAGARVPLIELDLAAPQAEALERNRPLVARLARVERFEQAAKAPQRRHHPHPRGRHLLPAPRRRHRRRRRTRPAAEDHRQARQGGQGHPRKARQRGVRLAGAAKRWWTNSARASKPPRWKSRSCGPQRTAWPASAVNSRLVSLVRALYLRCTCVVPHTLRTKD